MSSQALDHLALLPAYAAAATVIAVLLTELVVARAAAVFASAGVGIVVTAAAAIATPSGIETLCLDDGCSYATSTPAALIVVTLCGLTLAVLAMSVPPLRARDTVAPASEYVFLLTCALTGGVVLAYARDIVTIVVALETLTLPLYVLVSMTGRIGTGDTAAPRERVSAEVSVSFLLVSVAASAVTLLGAALLYTATGYLHLAGWRDTLGASVEPVSAVGVVLVIAGVAFKLAAVPLHGWAPGTYDGAPLPIAAYLSTASKLGGVVALTWVVTYGFANITVVAGFALAVLSVASMTVGNLVALRQRRAVRLLAWSSVAQAGYVLVPLAVFASVDATDSLVASARAATLGFAVFYVVIEIGAFSAVTALRPNGADGGRIEDFAGTFRYRPWAAGCLVLALIGLAGLPPGLAGLFAKITIMAPAAVSAPWLAVVVVINAVIGLVYYLRFAVVTVKRGRGAQLAPSSRWTAVTAVTAAVVAVVLGFAPQLVLGLAAAS